MAKQPEKIKVHCNTCLGETNHAVLALHNERETTGEQDDIWFDTDFMIVQCLGCEEVSFVKQTQFSEDYDYDPHTGEPYIPKTTTKYPPTIDRPLPDWLNDIHESISKPLEESYEALHAGSNMLAAMGARAALEQVMLSAIPDQGSFKSNINEFVKQGYLPEKLREPLSDALDVGSATIHRGYSPDSKTVRELFDILEGIIVSTCVVPNKADGLKKSTPLKPPKPKKKTGSS